MVGKFLINLGQWFNKHFPEKISADEVYQKIAAIELRLHEVTQLDQKFQLWAEAIDQQNDQIVALARKVEVLTTENSALKAASAIRTRVSSSIPMPGR